MSEQLLIDFDTEVKSESNNNSIYNLNPNDPFASPIIINKKDVKTDTNTTNLFEFSDKENSTVNISRNETLNDSLIEKSSKSCRKILNNNINVRSLIDNKLNKSKEQLNKDVVKNLLDDFENIEDKCIIEGKSSQTSISKRSKGHLGSLSFRPFNFLDSSNSSFEDLMSIEPKWLESESESTDSDIEMLKIPMLEKLNIKSPIEENEKTIINSPENNSSNKITTDTNMETVRKNFETLKRRISLEKSKDNINKNDAVTLMANLRDIILNISNEEKKLAASNLLRSLESVLTKNENSLNEKIKNENTSTKDCKMPRKPMLREGTFDVESNEKKPKEIVLIKDESVFQEIVKHIDKILDDNNVQKPSVNDNIEKQKNPTLILVLNTSKSLRRCGTEIFDKPKPIKSENEEKKYRRRSLSVNSTDNLKITNKPSLMFNNRKSLIPPDTKVNSDKAKPSQIEKNKLLTRTSSKISFNIKSKETHKKCEKGPMKANVPIIKVAPILLTQKSNFSTSTPLTQNKTKPPLNVSTTPNASKSRIRLSHLSQTPNPKVEFKTTFTKRRSMSNGNQTLSQTKLNSDFSKVTNKLQPIQIGVQSLKCTRKSINKENKKEMQKHN